MELSQTDFSLRDCLPARNLKVSYFHGATSQPLCGLTIGQMLEQAAREKPDHVVFSLPEFNQSLTFSELLKKANELAKGFLALGMRRGDLIFCYRLCDQHFFIVYIACALLGLMFTNPFIFTPNDVFLKRLLAKAQPAMLIADVGRDSNVRSLLEQLQENNYTTDTNNFTGFNTLKSVVTVRSLKLQGIPTIDDVIKKGQSIQDNTLMAAKQRVSPDDCVNILATSGSTGDTKMVCLSQYAVVNFSIICVARRAQGKQEVMGYINPVNDDVMASLGTIEMISQWRVGSVGIVFPQCVNFSNSCMVPLLQSIQDYRITRPGAYPFQILNMVNSPEFEEYDTSSLRGVTLVAQAISPETRLKLLELFPETVVAFGQSECLSIACTSPGNMGKDMRTVGYPLAHHEVKVVGESGQTLPVEEMGEIWVRGPCQFLRYLNDDERTREVLDSNGWVHSGDVGKMNSQGYITLIGRKADCIRYKYQGDVIYPGHIEKLFMEFEKVKEAKVVGVQYGDEDGESICLCVVPKPGISLEETELKTYCVDKLISRDRPRYYFIMDSFPLTGARQKVATEKLKETIKAKFADSTSDIS
ncbi:medium-chain acyl-CoA ligase ACSF2, mitochondrial-like isoform X3 [Liolophura sinensis]|uniref:medium-chain acyl-CoA ligase ACSF2, mitochondrial-like isoform X3 n=1 Tax=Liolophura sinensis TaxID=3198878 RepID=UPI003158D259